MKKHLVILTLILLLFSFYLKEVNAKGIILADNQEFIKIFRSQDTKLTQDLLEDLKDYNKVILHLGAKKVFTRGNAFFYRTSKENLDFFAKELKANHKKLYLWFLDSFGGEQFLELYDNHQEIIDANYQELNRLNLNYDGIVIDLEWINLDSGDNSKKYLEILAYLRKKFEDKEIYSFISIIDNQAENKKRGYNEQEILKYIDNIIPMLYIRDSGYQIKDDKLKLTLTANRVEDLREYYQAQGYDITVSLEGGIILERKEWVFFIKTANNFNYSAQTKLDYLKEEKYFRITGYSPQTSFDIRRNDGILEKIKKDDKLHFIEIKKDNLVKEDDYIWEYFILKD